MKKEKLVMLGLILLFGLFLISLASAVTLITPAADTTISGTAVLNATNTSLSGYFLNCTFYAKSASTANSSWSQIAFLVNSTGTINYINGTFASAGLEDANDYIFNATCWNATTLSEDTNTGITVDNTIPDAPSSLTPATNNLVTSTGSQTFSSTVTNNKTISCTYTIGRGGTTGTGQELTSGASATYSTSTCSFTKTFSSSKDNGNWYWYITASDGSNNTASSENILQVQIAPSGGTPYEVARKIQQTGTVKKAFYIGNDIKENAPAIIIFVLVILIILFFMRKK